MKTNVVMKRPFLGFNVLQRTSDGYFKANDFLNEWSAMNKDKGRRRLDEFLNSPKTKSFIEMMESEEFSEMRKTDGLENQCGNLHRGNSLYVEGIKGGSLHTQKDGYVKTTDKKTNKTK
jgi:hypothetical protein|nr:MAG TPA: N KilA-N domain [Caudoviricetes sp.]